MSPGRVFGTVGKLSARRGARALFRDVWIHGVKVIEFQSFFLSKKIRKLIFLSTVATAQGTLVGVEIPLDTNN